MKGIMEFLVVVCDFFSQPISLFPASKIFYKKKQFHGSGCGLVLSILILFMSSFYLGYLLLRMFVSKDDKYVSEIQVNNFSSGYDTFKMSDFNFLPSYEVALLRNTAEDYKILRSMGIIKGDKPKFGLANPFAF